MMSHMGTTDAESHELLSRGSLPQTNRTIDNQKINFEPTILSNRDEKADFNSGYRPKIVQ